MKTVKELAEECCLAYLTSGKVKLSLLSAYEEGFLAGLDIAIKMLKTEKDDVWEKEAFKRAADWLEKQRG